MYNALVPYWHGAVCLLYLSRGASQKSTFARPDVAKSANLIKRGYPSLYVWMMPYVEAYAELLQICRVAPMNMPRGICGRRDFSVICFAGYVSFRRNFQWDPAYYESFISLPPPFVFYHGNTFLLRNVKLPSWESRDCQAQQIVVASMNCWFSFQLALLSNMKSSIIKTAFIKFKVK